MVLVALLVFGAGLGLKIDSRIRGDGLASTDARYHADLASEILDGQPHRPFHQPPVYTWYFVACKALFGDAWKLAAVVLQGLMLVLSALLAGGMARRSMGPVPGSIVTVALLLSPHLINQASQLRPEIPTLLPVTAALACLVSPDRGPVRLILAAILMALACHVRNSVLGVAAGVGLWLFVLDPVGLDPNEGGSRWGRAFVRAALFSSVFLVLLVPWSLHVSRTVGHPAVIADNVERTARLGTTKDEFTAVEDLRGQQPEPGLLPWLERRVRAFWPLWFPLPFSALTSRASWLLMQAPLWLLTPGVLLAGLFSRGFRRSRLAGACAFPALFYTFALALVYVRVRYRFPVDGGLYVAAVWGWRELVRRFRREESDAPCATT